ncbi:kinase-like domain-containing protein [Geranomyces variabilis]|nr:kinase-like domain-containing protein [Geranomyces variabilis]
MQVFAKVLETIPPELSAQYLFTGLLGYGGNGFIAGALDRQTGAAVAVKFISKDRVPKGSLMVSDAFPGCSIPVEAEILRVAHHPNIVGFHALHVDDHFFMIVMEQVTNFLRNAAEQAGAPAALPVSTEDAAILSDKVSSPSLPQPTLKNLTRPRHGHPGDLDEFLYMYGPLHPLIQRRLCNQLISAYAHLANAGIAYLDFRGENIIVDREFNVRLVDFGMSQFLDSPSADAPQRRRRWISRDSQQQQQQQQRFSVYGTRPFSAPEILTGNGYLGPEADIWALGIIFYLVATGGIDPFASVEHILSTSSTHLKWPVGCTVAGPQKELIERMLAHLPVERPTVAEVCASEWLSERPVDDVAP